MQEKENDKQPIKKIIALKTTTNSEIENEDNEEIAFLTRRFKRLIRNKKFPKKGKFNEQEDVPLCFNCNKPGHLKRDCPLFKMKIFRKENRIPKKKALQATWDETD